MIDMALKALLTVAREMPTPSSLPGGGLDVYSQKMEVDIKRYAKVEKIPGGEISDCSVLSGVMFNKDVTHSKKQFAAMCNNWRNVYGSAVKDNLPIT